MSTSRRRTFGRTTLLGLGAAALAAVATARPAVEVGGVDGTDGALVRPPATDLPLPQALSLVVLAAWGAMLVLRGRVRRAVLALGLLAALGAAVALGAGLPGLTARVREPYVAAGAGSPDVSVTGWYAAAWVATLLSVALLAAAVAWVPHWPEMGARYDAPSGAPGAAPAPAAAAPAAPHGVDAQHGQDGQDGQDGHDGHDGVAGADGADGVDGAVDGDAQRALWRAIDEGRDPTADPAP